MRGWRRPAIPAPFGNRYLARGTAAAAFEAGQKRRIVMSEFSSVEKAIAACQSPAYQNALKALGDGAVRDIRIVEEARLTLKDNAATTATRAIAKRASRGYIRAIRDLA